MQRWLVLLFALLMPVQFAWAGAASYCQHEVDPQQTQHFGHHEHVHQSSLEKSSTRKVAGDDDCSTCHAAGSAILFDGSSLTAAPASSAAAVPHRHRPIPAALARAPDRPQWLRLA